MEHSQEEGAKRKEKIVPMQGEQGRLKLRFKEGVSNPDWVANSKTWREKKKKVGETGVKEIFGRGFGAKVKKRGSQNRKKFKRRGKALSRWTELGLGEKEKGKNA